METIGKRIRERRKAAKITQVQLANFLGIKQSSITDWELGKANPELAKIEKIAKFLQCSPGWLLTGKEEEGAARYEPYPTPNARLLAALPKPPIAVRVYGHAIAGLDGEFPLNGNELYQVAAPAELARVKNVYGVIVSGESMSPRYEEGEVVFVNPEKHPRRGDYVIAQIAKNGSGAPLAFIKQFVSRNQETLLLSQFNPNKQLSFPNAHVVSVHVIVMAGHPVSFVP